MLQHAKAGLRSKASTQDQKIQSNMLVDYLEELNESLESPKYIPTTEAEQEKYLGDYLYGEGEKDGFSVKRNMRKMLSLGKLGKFGGGWFESEGSKCISL